MNALALALALLLPSRTPGTADFPDLTLKVTVPELVGLQEHLGVSTDQMRGSWSGKLGENQVELALFTFPLEEWGFREPGGVSVVMVEWLREHGDFDVDESLEKEGKYGAAPVLAVVSGKMRAQGEVVGREYVAAGLLPAHGYAIHVRVKPEPTDEVKQALAAFFEKGIAYSGAERDPLWTTEEIQARWTKDAPDALHADFEKNLSKKAWVKNAVVRTDHYLIMTNASGGKKFAEQLEKNYDAIGKLFPLPSGKGCRLMPIFLFRTADDYYGFCQKRGMTLDQAKKTAGHASADYYSTWYESPTDPTHIHEQTHQIFGNRMFLSGGGSWYQEGLATYVEKSKNDYNVVASQVAKAKHLPLVELVQRPSLVFSSSEDRKEGGSEAADLYTQSGLLIEFLRDSKWGKDKFPRFLQVVGRVRRGDLSKLRVAFEDIYGVQLEAVDQEFQKYCAAR